MKDTLNSKRSINSSLLEELSELENMKLETAMSVILDYPLTSLLELNDDAEEAVFGELQVSDIRRRRNFTFREFIDTYPSLLKMSGMTMGGYVRSEADIYIELANTIACIGDIYMQTGRMDIIRKVRNNERSLPDECTEFMIYAQKINAVNVLCSMTVTDYFANLKDIYQISDDAQKFCNMLISSMTFKGISVKNLLFIAGKILPEDAGYKIIEELILTPFSIARIHEKIPAGIAVKK